MRNHNILALQLAGLDLWRAVMLSLGVFLHASQTNHWSEWVIVITRQFRMEAFFTISGMLTVLSFHTKDPSVWIKNRIIQLGVPLIVTMLFLNKISEALFAYAKGEGFIYTIKLKSLPILHSWFLASLLIINLAFYAAQTLNIKLFISKRVLNNIRQVPKALMAGAVLLFLLILSQVIPVGSFITKAVLDGKISGLDNIFFRAMALNSIIVGSYTVYYSAFFALGIFIIKHKKIINYLRYFVTHFAILLIILCSLYIVAAVISPQFILANSDNPFSWERIFASLSRIVFAPIVCGFIIASAVSINHVPNVLRIMSKAGYTIYVVHMFIISLLYALWKAVGLPGVAPYLIVCFAALGISTLIHYFFVARFSLPALLLNGRYASSKALKIK